MTRNQRMKIFTGLLCFIAMLVDAHLTRTLTAWSQGTYIWNVHLLLLLLLFSSAALSKHYMVTTAIILGSIFDLYYIGVLGIYAVALPLVVWIMYLLRETIFQNIFTYFFGMIILMTGFDVLTMTIQYFFKLTNVQVGFFITRYLGPTLLVNILLFFILYKPLRKLFPRE